MDSNVYKFDVNVDKFDSTHIHKKFDSQGWLKGLHYKFNSNVYITSLTQLDVYITSLTQMYTRNLMVR